MSDKLFYNNKEYILGATVGPKAGTGGITYSLFNLNQNSNYKFIVVSYKSGTSSTISNPISIFSFGEYREPVYVFAWAHPAEVMPQNLFMRTYSQRNTQNLVSPSQATSLSLTDWEKEYYDGVWGNHVVGSNFRSEKGYTAPDGSTSATKFTYTDTAGSYHFITLRNIVNHSHEYIEVQKGVTYYFSIWMDVTRGSTSASFSPRFHDGATGTWINDWAPYGYQIEPVLGARALGDLPYTVPAGLTGWNRFTFAFMPYTGATNYVNLSAIVSGGKTGNTDYYLWGAQLEESSGSTATAYKPNIISNVKVTGNLYDRAGNTLYDNSIENIPNWCSANGITYFWPQINIWNETNYNMEVLSRNNYDDFYIRRACDIFKLIPGKKRSIRPKAMEDPFVFEMYEDAITGLSFSAPGAVYSYLDVSPTGAFYGVTSSVSYMGNVWPVKGISAGLTAWDKFFNTFSSRGGTIDYMFFDYEFGPFSTLYVEKGNTQQGWTAARKIVEDPRYSQPWNGVTALKDMMDELGATLINMPDYYYSDYNHLAWSRTTNAQTQKAYDLIISPALNKYFPNLTVSNYEYFYQPKGITNGSYDQATHMRPGDGIIGNASAPTLYGDIWDSYLNSGSARLPLSDPTRIERHINTGGPTVPISILPRPWISFMRMMLMVRVAKAARPDVPLTPWIANVKWPYDNYKTTKAYPNVAFCDQKIGYNEKTGITYTQQGGNSAYYYEMIRHCMLMGTKAFPFFNANLYSDVRTPGYDETKSNAYNDKLYLLSGLTYHMEEIIPLDNVIHEVHNLIGGFTLTTADTSRPNWLAPYFASGAPSLNGTTWWWRVTVGGTHTINVNGTVLSGISGPWGTWVSTTGPTLAGVNITDAPIPENRDDFVAFAWTWPSSLGGYQWTYQWSVFGSTGGPESGTTANYYTSSEHLGNTNWFGLNAGQAKPSWLNVISGVTDPFGGTGAYTLNAQGLTSNQFTRYGQYIGGLPAGKTYIMSMYINTSGTTTGWVVHNEWQAAYATPVGITMRQILPVGASAASGSHRPTINFVNGQTGWDRFAWEFFAQPVTQATGIGGSSVAGLTWENFRSYLMERTFTSGVTANITIYGPQLEEV